MQKLGISYEALGRFTGLHKQTERDQAMFPA